MIICDGRTLVFITRVDPAVLIPNELTFTSITLEVLSDSLFSTPAQNMLSYGATNLSFWCVPSLISTITSDGHDHDRSDYGGHDRS